MCAGHDPCNIVLYLYSKNPYLHSISRTLCNNIMYFFSGDENSRVQAHIDGDEFSAHILTEEAEYNVEVRAVSTPCD